MWKEANSSSNKKGNWEKDDLVQSKHVDFLKIIYKNRVLQVSSSVESFASHEQWKLLYNGTISTEEWMRTDDCHGNQEGTPCTVENRRRVSQVGVGEGLFKGRTLLFSLEKLCCIVDQHRGLLSLLRHLMIHNTTHHVNSATPELTYPFTETQVHWS